ITFPDPAEAAALTQAINEAEKVTFFVGVGARYARKEGLELAEKVKAPVGHALGGKMYIQYDNPCDVGMSGLLGHGAAHDAMNEADLLTLLGTDLPYPDLLPQDGAVDTKVDEDDINH